MPTNRSQPTGGKLSHHLHCESMKTKLLLSFIFFVLSNLVTVIVMHHTPLHVSLLTNSCTLKWPFRGRAPDKTASGYQRNEISSIFYWRYQCKQAVNSDFQKRGFLKRFQIWKKSFIMRKKVFFCVSNIRF